MNVCALHNCDIMLFKCSKVKEIDCTWEWVSSRCGWLANTMTGTGNRIKV